MSQQQSADNPVIWVTLASALHFAATPPEKIRRVPKQGYLPMRWLFVIAGLLGTAACPLMAAQAVVHLSDGHARAVSDAVVMLTPDAAVAVAPATKPPATYIIDQRDETFTPYVQLLRPGDNVIFRNSDVTRHHAYSFSPIKTFELVLHPGESSPAISMDKAGIAAIGCNIHDHMITYLFVSALPNSIRIKTMKTV